jgi:hypothetical protein
MDSSTPTVTRNLNEHPIDFNVLFTTNTKTHFFEINLSLINVFYVSHKKFFDHLLTPFHFIVYPPFCNINFKVVTVELVHLNTIAKYLRIQ